MNGHKAELRQILLDKGLKFEQGVTSNGSTCKWLIDTREVLLDQRGLKLASMLFYKKLRLFQSKQLGSLTMAGSLMVAGLINLYSKHNQQMDGFIIRYKRKQHGLQKQIEGNFVPGEKSVIVDDFMRKGGLIMDAIRIVEEEGGRVEGVISLIEYDKQARSELMKRGFKTESIYTLNDFFIGIPSQNKKLIKPKKVWWRREGCNWTMFGPKPTGLSYDKALLFVNNEGRLLFVDTDSNQINWYFPIENKSSCCITTTPALCGNRICLGDNHGLVYCLNAKNGNLLWKKKRGDMIGSSPLIIDNQLYLGVCYSRNTGIIISCSLKDGSLNWYFKTDSFIKSRIAALEDKGVVIAGSDSGSIYALKASTGKVLWTFKTNGPVRGGFAADRKQIYFGSADGNIYCLNKLNGKIVWKRRVGPAIYTDPQISNNTLIFSTISKRIFCLDKQNGSLMWYYQSEGEIFSNIALDDRRVFCGCSKGFLYELDIKSGKLLKKYDIEDKIITTPVLFKDNLFIGCQGQHILMKV